MTEEILEFLIEDEEYLAVFFSGPCEEDDPCDDILEELVMTKIYSKRVIQLHSLPSRWVYGKLTTLLSNFIFHFCAKVKPL